MFKDDVKKYLNIKEGCASKKKGKKLFAMESYGKCLGCGTKLDDKGRFTSTHEGPYCMGCLRKEDRKAYDDINKKDFPKEYDKDGKHIKEGCAPKGKLFAAKAVDDETNKKTDAKKLYAANRETAPEATKQKIADMSDGAKEVGKRSPLTGYPSFSTSNDQRIAGKLKGSYSKDARKYATGVTGESLFSPIKKEHVSLAAEYSKAENMGGKEGIAAMSKLKKKFYAAIKTVKE